MISRRSLTLAALMLLPLLVYLALGAYALWETGLFAWTFWILPGFWIVTWIVAVLWKPPGIEVHLDVPHPRHFTPRDESALAIVRRYQEQIDVLTPQQLVDPEFYLQQSRHLARDLAEHYHPGAKDLVSSLTVPEVLAAIRLVVDDMERWMLEAVPGSQLLTIRQWKWLRHAPRWLDRAQNAVWAASVLVNPANVLKYLASNVTVGPLTRELHTEFLAAMYLRFVRQLGFYLIEMNSGRLRGGADRYRLAFETPDPITAGSQSAPATLVPESLNVAVVGQVKAGKSSVINALVGERVARSDVLPETIHVNRYRLSVPESNVQLTLLDTPGYADSGATRQQKDEITLAVREADLLLLVVDAHSPAKSADRQLMDDLRKWFDEHPALKPAPVIICLTHIDLLSPVMEWDPPYDWQAPRTRKEQSIHGAVDYVRGLFSEVARDVVPVCSAADRCDQKSVVAELLPALLQVLSEGQIAALLRAYHQDLDEGRLRTLFRQLRNSGKQLLRIWLEERLGAAAKTAGGPFSSERTRP
jgi:small GTP-binding protein